MQYTDTMTQYIEDINKIKRLTAAEEYDLAVEMRNGNKKARERFIEANLYLVVSMSKSYKTYGVSYEDMFQEGVCGLIKAVDTYNPIKAIRFMNYAHLVIRRHVELRLAANISVLSIPTHTNYEMAKIIRTQHRLKDMMDAEPTVDEIAEITCIPEEKVKKVLCMIAPPIDIDEEIEDDLYLRDCIPNDEEEVLESYADTVFKNKAIKDWLLLLTPREQDVMRKYYGLDGKEPMTFREISEIYHCTTEYIRSIRNKAIKRISDKIDLYRRQGNTCIIDLYNTQIA